MTDEEMENFVFAVLPKKTAAKMQKELQDLVIKVLFVPLQNHPFPKWSAILNFFVVLNLKFIPTYLKHFGT